MPPQLHAERRPLDSELAAKIAQLYATAEFATPFCHPLWVGLLGEALRREAGYCVVLSGDELVAALPYTRRAFRGIPLTINESLPYDCYSLPLVSPGLNAVQKREAVRAAYQCLIHTATLARAFPPEWFGEGAFDPGRSVGLAPSSEVDEIFVKRLEGLSDEAALLNSYAPHHRKQVLSALKAPITVSRVETLPGLEMLYGLVTETMSREGVSVKFSFDTVVRGGLQLIRQGLGTAYIADCDGMKCAGAFMLRSKNIMIYWLGATTGDKKALRHYPMFAVLHKAMLDALKEGSQVMELGAAPTPGLKDFKSKWGAQAMNQRKYIFGDKLALQALRLWTRMRAA
jgi:hypothetical protein